MGSSRQLHLGAFMRPVGIHTGWWRMPGAFPDANFNLAAPRSASSRRLERGCFDAFFMADHLAVLNMPMAALRRSGTATSFEPMTLLSALAMVTRHIGLIATASTTFEEPYHIARRFASLDHISGGRAGWNIVTTSNPDSALNFGMTDHVEHDERYRRAREFYTVVTGLWDSWADDAWLRDQASGIFFDPARLHVLDHKGEHLSVRGPLNIARPVQGWPVIVQAGASEAGRQLAAETAEVIFASSRTVEDGRLFYADVKGADARRWAGTPAQLKILPGGPWWSRDARWRRRRPSGRSWTAWCIRTAACPIAVRLLGVDASGFDLDGTLPEIPQTNASKSGAGPHGGPGRARQADRAGSWRQLAGGYAGLADGRHGGEIADEHAGLAGDAKPRTGST